MSPSAETFARIDEAARAVRPYGFLVDRRWGPDLRAYEPFAIFPQPSEHVVGARGTALGERVEAYEYLHTFTDADGHAQTSTELVVVAHHRSIRGAAAFSPDGPAWGGVAAFIDAALWVPPFTPLKLFQLLAEEKHPDRHVGAADFDRLYRVRAASDAAARDAIPPALSRVVVGLAFRGEVEIRPGVLLARFPGSRFDDEGLLAALGVGAALLGTFVASQTHGYRS